MRNINIRMIKESSKQKFIKNYKSMKVCQTITRPIRPSIICTLNIKIIL